MSLYDSIDSDCEVHYIIMLTDCTENTYIVSDNEQQMEHSSMSGPY